MKTEGNDSGTNSSMNARIRSKRILKKDPKLKKDRCGTAPDERGKGKIEKGRSEDNQKAA